MAPEPVRAPPQRRWVPWWLDPYSENPIAFGILFLLCLVLLVGTIVIVKLLFVHNPGGADTRLPGMLLDGVRRVALGRAY